MKGVVREKSGEVYVVPVSKALLTHQPARQPNRHETVFASLWAGAVL